MELREAVEKVIALQELTNATGSKTTRSQCRILQTLSDDDMATAAIEIKRYWRLNAILSGKANGGDNGR
jgi:hypothetical protein